MNDEEKSVRWWDGSEGGEIVASDPFDVRLVWKHSVNNPPATRTLCLIKDPDTWDIEMAYMKQGKWYTLDGETWLPTTFIHWLYVDDLMSLPVDPLTGAGDGD